MYMVGDFDYETGKLDYYISKEIDWGLDYYAPQSFETMDGRRIMVAWANEWEWMPLWKDWGPSYREGWSGFFNLPREVRKKPDGLLQFVPVKELENLRVNPIKKEKFVLEEQETEIKAGDGICYEIKFNLDLQETTADQVEIKLRCGDGKNTVCLFDLKKGEMSVDRNFGDGWSKGISRSILNLKEKNELDVHVFVDRSSVEIFADQYSNNHSNNVFASDEQNQIFMSAYGGKAVISGLETYGLKLS